MALILNIETSSTNCSVSLSENGVEKDCIELNDGYSHAENLHVFIDSLLKNNRVPPHKLNAVAISAGPGSYTGLRIGTSAAKGLCYALDVPLIALSTLELMAYAALRVYSEADFYLPMLDARRMEVYCALYDRHLKAVIEPRAMIIEETSVQTLKQTGRLCVFGDGMPKCRALFESHLNCSFMENMIPSAKHMHEAAFQKFIRQDFENIAYFEPYYLKEYMFAQKQK